MTKSAKVRAIDKWLTRRLRKIALEEKLNFVIIWAIDTGPERGKGSMLKNVGYLDALAMLNEARRVCREGATEDGTMQLVAIDDGELVDVTDGTIN